jgi:hypothetical protein
MDLCRVVRPRCSSAELALHVRLDMRDNLVGEYSRHPQGVARMAGGVLHEGDLAGSERRYVDRYMEMIPAETEGATEMEELRARLWGASRMNGKSAHGCDATSERGLEDIGIGLTVGVWQVKPSINIPAPRCRISGLKP